MGIIGGELGYRLLRKVGRGPSGTMEESHAYDGRSKIEALLGRQVWDELAGKVVIDFGCGDGTDAVEIARRGAARVIGVDIQDKWLLAGRRRAKEQGVDDRCTFSARPKEAADVIVALDSFEHFDDPEGVLDAMYSMLKPGGYVITSFGPTWFHPLGGHLFSVFPWAHLIFTEAALIRWRSDFKTDGATRFGEVAGGLNQMTIGRFERIVRASRLECASLEALPIRQLRWCANRWTREFTTAVVRCKLVRREAGERRQPVADEQTSEAA